MESHEWSACDLAGEHQKTTRHTKAECPVHLLPNLTMDVTGEYTGDAYPTQAEYRIHMRPMIGGERYLLSVEDSSGTEVTSMPLSTEEVDGIFKVAETNHSLDVYDGDWKIPVGIDRAVYWDLGDVQHNIRLNEQEIDEIAEWLRYATGVQEWSGGWEWSY